MKDEVGSGGEGVGFQGPKGSRSDLEGPRGSKGRPTGQGTRESRDRPKMILMI